VQEVYQLHNHQNADIGCGVFRRRQNVPPAVFVSRLLVT